ncbi:hypothetical protein GBF38_020331, partial [Nibea albiflora]
MHVAAARQTTALPSNVKTKVYKPPEHNELDHRVASWPLGQQYVQNLTTGPKDTSAQYDFSTLICTDHNNKDLADSNSDYAVLSQVSAQTCLQTY